MSDQRPDEGSRGRGRGDSASLTRLSSLILRVARGSYRIARRLVIATVGVTVVLVGAVMIFTPGPAIVIIPIGLAILAIEFVWARRLLRLFRVRARQAARAYRRGDRQYWRRWFRRR